MAKLGVLATIERLIGRSMPTIHNTCRLLRVVIAVAALSSLLAISLSCDWNALFGLQIDKRCDGQVSALFMMPRYGRPIQVSNVVNRSRGG